MKTNPELSAAGRNSDRQSGLAATHAQMHSVVDPPTGPHTWFNSYNEEWEAFVEDQAIHKKRPGINHEEPEPLPRVWNCPQGISF